MQYVLDMISLTEQVSLSKNVMSQNATNKKERLPVAALLLCYPGKQDLGAGSGEARNRAPETRPVRQGAPRQDLLSRKKERTASKQSKGKKTH